MHRAACAGVAGFLLAVAGGMQAEQVSRVSDLGGQSRIGIHGNIHPLASHANDIGKTSGSLVLPRVTLFFNRTASQQAQLVQLLRELQDPASANYHKWLTPQQFADRFGVAESDMQKTADWLAAQGLNVVERPSSRSYIVFSGTAAQIRSAFGTEIHNYAVSGEQHYANAGMPTLPVGLATVVLGFRGMNDFRPRPRGVRMAPRFTSSISGNHFMAPDDFATIYGLKPLYDKGIDGTGQTIAVVGQTDIVASDIQTFRSVSGLPALNLQTVLVPGSTDPGLLTNDVVEADLDLEWAGAVARGASLIFVNSKNVFDSLQYAITNNVAPVISISYGDCELNFSSGELNAMNSLALQASAQGITVVAASGDTGAADCDYPTGNTVVSSASHGPAIDIPAGIPNVTGIGGTQFNDPKPADPNTDPYWSPTNNSMNGSALSYIPELGWNETSIELQNKGSIAASGGGASTFFPKPDWQKGNGVPSDGFRDVPDLSFHASFNSDGYLVCSRSSCVNGYRAADNSLMVVGGTSAGTPAFAGIVALLNQISGPRQGNVNPRLYQLASTSTDAFHDVIGGDNIVPCTAGSTGCPGSGSFGFSAGTGYDQVTGLGTINAYNFVSEWASTTSAPPPADFALSASATTLAVRRGSSGSVNVSVQALNGFSNTVTLSCTVPATLANVTCSASPSTISGSGTVNVTITAAAQSSSNQSAPFSPAAPLFALLPAGLVLPLGLSRRWRKSLWQHRARFSFALVLVIGLAAMGCGGTSSASPSSSSNSGSGTGATPGTTPTSPPVTGTVVIQGTSGADVHVVSLSVSVS